MVLVIWLLVRDSNNVLPVVDRTSSEHLNLMPASLPVAGGGTGLENLASVEKSSQREDFGVSKKRLVIESTNLSLVVDDVKDVSKKIIAKTEDLGGFMVESSLTTPQESPFGTVVVRIPEDKADEALDYFRSLAVKVSSERVLGQDVTEQYEDINERLATLAKTKAKFEEILEKAVDVDDILRVQRELINLQSQIDTLKGRQKYLEKSAALTKITIYLSSDELALPYQPEGSFRPKVVFKQAVRSLIKTFRGIAKLFIWLAVYAPVWGGVLIIIFLIKRFGKRKG